MLMCAVNRDLLPRLKSEPPLRASRAAADMSRLITGVAFSELESEDNTQIVRRDAAKL